MPKKTNSKEKNSKSNSKNRKKSRSKDGRRSVSGSASKPATGSSTTGLRTSRRDPRLGRQADKLAPQDRPRVNVRSERGNVQGFGPSDVSTGKRGVENLASAQAIATPHANIPNKVSFVEIDENHDGQRLDNFLITHLKGVPKAHIYRIIRKGEIRVNKGRVKQTTRLKQGDSLRIPPIRLSERSLDGLDGQKYSFLGKLILFEDDALLIINKPCGMAVHAGSGITVGVIEALRAYRSDLKYIELVHRLDRETSGVLVLAKKASALKILHNDFKTNSLKNPRLDKRYLTLVKGPWLNGTRRITKALNTDARRHGERYVVVDPNGRYASSIVTPKSVSDIASLVEVKLLTGRTHQVRVHALSENHPVAGDQKYGDQEFNRKMKSQGLSRLFLHAAKLTFFHPVTEKSTTIEASLPSELTSVLTNLSIEFN
ncbi:MAG: RluA family pseudouridine synthase [Arenicella sp.]|nr:RluA family pseudouridine synthase [Arenicella sp.]